MTHKLVPVRVWAGWKCRVCGAPVGHYRKSGTPYWRHITKGPEIVYGRALREGS